jgi:hypothetical protein
MTNRVEVRRTVQGTTPRPLIFQRHAFCFSHLNCAFHSQEAFEVCILG